MSMFSEIHAEVDRAIVNDAIAKAKKIVVDRHPDSDLTQGQVITILENVRKECERKIQE